MTSRTGAGGGSSTGGEPEPTPGEPTLELDFDADVPGDADLPAAGDAGQPGEDGEAPEGDGPGLEPEDSEASEPIPDGSTDAPKGDATTEPLESGDATGLPEPDLEPADLEPPLPVPGGTDAGAAPDGVPDAGDPFEAGPFSEQATAAAGDAEPEEPQGEPETSEAGGESAVDEPTPEVPVPADAGAPAPMVPSSPWPLWAWMMVGIAALVVVVGVFGDVLSEAIFLDLLSFWPVFVILFLVAAALRSTRHPLPARLTAVVPLLVLSWLAVAAALHLGGWSQLPSSAADFDGPAVASTTSATVQVDIPGELRLLAADTRPMLYRVEMQRRGGDVGPPEAIEQIDAGGALVDLVERPDPGWYEASGWDLMVVDGIEWRIEVIAETVDIDLSTAVIGGGRIEGNGTVMLGTGAAGVTLVLAGDLTVIIPEGQAVSLEGAATVPPRWVETEDGFRTPEGGEELRIVVEAGAVSVEDP